MKTLVLTKELDINGIVYPIGSTLKVKSKGIEYYYILQVNETKIYSIWKRKNFIDFKCS